MRTYEYRGRCGTVARRLVIGAKLRSTCCTNRKLRAVKLHEHLVHIDGHCLSWMTRGKDLNRRTRPLRRRLAVFLAVVGPGLITSNVDNDAGGISTYTTAGAQFGYALLWSLIPMTIALYVSEEMCARMGVVTGKGLSDLIREEFGFRSTFLRDDRGPVCRPGQHGRGIRRRRRGFRSDARQQIYFRAAGGACRVAAGRLRDLPDRRKDFPGGLRLLSFLRAVGLSGQARLALRRASNRDSNLQFNAPYLLMLTGLVGTTIAPWQFFYLQAGFVEKRVGPRQYKHARMDVLVGSISCMVIVFFIIVCCAATLNAHGLTKLPAPEKPPRP